MADNKYCPYCGQQIKAVASKCQYCHANVPKLPPENKKAYIKGLSGQFAGETIPLDESYIIIRRNPQVANLVYDQSQKNISRKHLKISFNEAENQFILEDYSSNGTFLFPDKKLESSMPYHLKPGVRFYISDPGESFELCLDGYSDNNYSVTMPHKPKLNDDQLLSTGATAKLGALVPEMISLMGGIISAVILVYPLTVLLGFLGILFAPIVEEICKVVGLFFLALFYPGATSTKKKGIILGGMAGLGFAFTENMFYILRIEMTITYAHFAGYIALIRIIPLISHVLMSALVGIGLVSFSQRSFSRNPIRFAVLLENARQSLLFPLLIISITLHLVYNVLASTLDIVGAIMGLGLNIYLFIKISSFLPDSLEHVDLHNPIQLVSKALSKSAT